MSGPTGTDRPTSLPVEAAERPPSNEALLVVDEVSTRFRTRRGLVTAVDRVSFDLHRGRTLGLVGESGSGKSVLSRTIMGLLPRRNVVLDGRVVFDGIEVSALPPGERRRTWGLEMAMVFQDPMTSLNPVVPIGRQITESLRHHLDMRSAEARETALALLRSVGIPEPARRLRQYPHELSGGMRQRVVIAIALACGPKLLFADEPTTALDVTVQAQILGLLDEQRRDRNMAIVLVTHDLGVAAGHTDDIAVMYAGQIVERAPTRTLFAAMRMPYTEALLRSIPRVQDPTHTRLADHSRPAAGPGPAAGRLPLRPPLPLRQGPLPGRDAAAHRGRAAGPLVPVLVSRRHRKRSERAAAEAPVSVS